MTKKPNPADFPAATPWASWCEYRAEGKEFVQHGSLSLAKNAAQHCAHDTATRRRRGSYDYEYAMSEDYHVYKWVGDAWVEQFVVKKGEYRFDHPWWERPKRKKNLAPVSEEDEASAIESIMEVFDNGTNAH